MASSETPGPATDDASSASAAPVGRDHGRAGRNLPAAIGLGVVLGAYVVASLIFFKPSFVLLVAVALCMGSLELYHALQRHGMKASIQPIIVGTLAISVGS